MNISLLTISGLYKEKGEGRLIASEKTDKNGNTPIIKLPAINKLTRDEDDKIMKLYLLEVTTKNYYTAHAIDLQIYPGITTTYNISLRHVGKDENPKSQFEFIIEPRINWL